MKNATQDDALIVITLFAATFILMVIGMNMG
jgi:hypothetical protein